MPDQYRSEVGGVPTYVLFPPQVHSNGLDFELADTTHDGVKMRGVVARREVSLEECPLFIGTFDGVVRTPDDCEQKIEDYARRKHVRREVALQRAMRYNLALVHYSLGCELDPSDGDGELLPAFRDFLAYYVNEVPPGCHPSATYVFNGIRQRYEMWLIDSVATGEEIFTYYGVSFERSYPVDHEAGSQLEPALIAATSSYTIDERVGARASREAPA